MKKTLITSVTAFAIVLSAGMAMAGPLRDHSQRGPTRDVRSPVSQTRNYIDRTANTHQSTNLADSSFELSSARDLGQTNPSSMQQQLGDGSDLVSNEWYKLEGLFARYSPRR